jgi:hypothetical protein
MPWVLCMPQLFSWGYRILVQFSQLSQLSAVFYRERAAHMYSPLPYALGQVRAHWYSDSFIQRSIYMQLQELINLTERISNFVVRK